MSKPKRPPVSRRPEPVAPTREAAGTERVRRGVTGESWIWGRHAVLAALGNPDRKILRFVASAETAEMLAQQPRIGDATPQVLDREALHRLLPANAVHQGLALLSKPLPSVALEDMIDRAAVMESAVVLVLDQVSDPHNVGAVLRSAAAFGARAVLVPDRNVPEVSGVLAKAASGALEHVPLIRVVNLVRALDQLKQAGWWTVGLADDAERTLAEHKLSGKIVLVLGSEGEGLRRLTRESCDLMARLPTSGPVASLNVSNAAAVALYELVRV